jgi:hypothetical protein
VTGFPSSWGQERRWLKKAAVPISLSHSDFQTGKVGEALFILIEERKRELCLVKAIQIRLNKQMTVFFVFQLKAKIYTEREICKELQMYNLPYQQNHNSSGIVIFLKKSFHLTGFHFIPLKY